MVLLRVLVELGYSSLSVFHINHQLRGEESEADAELVSRTMQALDLEGAVCETDTQEYADATKQSIETAARNLRRMAWADEMNQTKSKGVILAHHADDQVETVLMNLFRGAGSRGLGGMDAIRNFVINGKALTLIRPFLAIPRRKLREFAKQHDVAFREDSSNAELDATRNRVRHELLPMARKIFDRDVDEAVLRASRLCRLDESCAMENLVDLSVPARLPVNRLRNLPENLQWRFLREWLREQGIGDVSMRLVSDCLTVALSRENPAKVNLPGGHHFRRSEATLFIEWSD